MGSRACGAALAGCVLIAGLHLCAPLVSGARAADWSITSALSSTVVVNDNVSLRVDPLGTAVGFINSASLSISALKPTGSFSVDSNIGNTTYVGPGAPDDLGGVTFGSSAALQKSDKLTQYGLTASVAIAPTAQIELLEDEQTRSTGETVSYSAGATISRQLGPRDSLSAALAWSAASAEDDGRDSSSVSLSGSWNHQISDLTSVGASVSRSQSESQQDEDNVVWGFNGQFSTALSPRLSASTSAGFSIVDGPGAADLTGENEIEGEPLFRGPTFNIALTYALKTTTVSLTASEAISQTTFGDLRQSRSFGFTVAQAINRRANLVLSGAHVSSQGGSIGDRTSRTVSLVYSHSFTPEWNGSFTYTYRDVDRTDGFARSNAAFFALSRGLTLVP